MTLILFTITMALFLCYLVAKIFLLEMELEKLTILYQQAVKQKTAPADKVDLII